MQTFLYTIIRYQWVGIGPNLQLKCSMPTHTLSASPENTRSEGEVSQYGCSPVLQVWIQLFHTYN